MTKREVIYGIVVGFAEMFEKEVSDALHEIYFNALDELSEDQIRHAANVLTKTARFFPKPVDFLEAVKGSPADRELRMEAAALDAWESLSCNPDVYTTVTIEDPAAARALVELGGWIEFCNIPADEMKWAKKDFVRAYKAFCGNTALKPRKFIGLLERNNERDGYFPEQMESKELEMCYPSRIIKAPEKQIEGAGRDVKQLREKTNA